MPAHNHDNGLNNKLVRNDGNATTIQTDSTAGEIDTHNAAPIQSVGGGQTHDHTIPAHDNRPAFLEMFSLFASSEEWGLCMKLRRSFITFGLIAMVWRLRWRFAPPLRQIWRQTLSSFAPSGPGSIEASARPSSRRSTPARRPMVCR